MSGNLKIHITFDPNAPPPAGNDFINGLADAIGYFETTFKNPVTVNLQVSWLPMGIPEPGKNFLDAQTNLPNNDWVPVSYGQLQQKLPNLPPADPTAASGSYIVTPAEAKALGLHDANTNEIDANITFNSDLDWAFQRSELGQINDLGQPGEYDFVGAAEHEISEAMGRIAWAGYDEYLPFEHNFTPLDLFRFNVLEEAAPTGNQWAYFSTNGGVDPSTLAPGIIAAFDTVIDYGDWGTVTPSDPNPEHDPYGVVQDTYVPYQPSNTDLQVMEAIGWEPTPTAGTTFLVSDATANEGHDITFYITIDHPDYSNPQTSSYGIWYKTQDGSALAGQDYTAAGPTEVFFSSSNPGPIPITVHTQNAVDATGQQTFYLDIYDYTDTIKLGVAVGTIIDEPPQPQYTVTASPDPVDQGIGSITFTIDRSGPILPEETLYASTVNGTSNGYAINDSDYAKTIDNLPVVFAAGATAETVPLSIFPDPPGEPDETFGFIVQRNTSDPLSTYVAKTDFTIHDDATPDSIHIIKTVADLENINNDLSGTYVLGNDIDASGFEFLPIASDSNGVVQFTGTLDGDGHVITNLNLNSASTFAGLIGYIGKSGTVENLGLTNETISNVTGYGVGARTGGIAGQNDGTIFNSYMTGAVNTSGSSTSWSGGLAGINGGTIDRSHAAVRVSAANISYNEAGGLVGYNTGGFNPGGARVSNSFAVGSVDASRGGGPSDGGDEAGGLIGDNQGSVLQSYAAISVTGGHLNGYGASGAFVFGGLVGNNQGIIDQTHADGAVSGDESSFNGGLVGAAQNSGTITESYATGHLSGASTNGGIAGLYSTSSTVSGALTDNYWDTESTGVSKDALPSGSTGLPTAQLQSGTLPAGFDPTIWTARPGSYPTLVWQDRVQTTYQFTVLNDPNAVSYDGGTETLPNAINDAGQIVGKYYSSGGGEAGFVYNNGTYSAITMPFTVEGIYLWGINNSGEIVGQYNATDGSANGFLLSGGTVTTIDDPLSDFHSQATGVNDSGQIVGNYTNAGSWHAFLYNNGSYTTLDDPRASHSSSIASGTLAQTINNAGQVVGYYYDSNGIAHGFLYSNGTYTDLTDPAATTDPSIPGNTFATGINNVGQIVGYFKDSGGTNHAFLYSAGQYTTINNDAAPNDPTMAASINDAGIIVGTFGPNAFVANPTFNDAACYARGTRISTPRGEIPIERLREGELVRTASGEAKPIIWIGHSQVDCRRHPKPENFNPVRVRAGAFGPDLPKRDLVLSPGHAIFAEGVLIPVCHLVNGVSIVREENAGEVTYYHLELPEHDVLLAEGLPAESYLDDGNRAAFENGPVRMLHPDYTPLSWDNACAPMRESGEEVAAVKRRLRARLEELSYELEESGQIELTAGGIRLEPRFARGGLRHFRVPARCEELRLVSPRGIPAGFFEGSADNRWLGAQLALVLLDGEWIPLDSPILADGFYGLEQDASGAWRWTNGAATLRLPPATKPRLLELYIRDVMRSWKAPEQQAASSPVTA